MLVDEAALLSALAHELRTPLTAIRGFADLLESLDGAGDEAVRRELTARLARNTRQLEALLDSMLDAARDGRLEPLRPQALNLHAVVLDVVDELRPALDLHTVHVGGTITYAFADPFAVTRVLTSLLTNAAQYSPSRSRIDVRTSSIPGGAAHITISDAGPGIDHEDRERVFEAFWRGDRARQDVRGLGVGLSIARELCRRSGGDICVHDTPAGFGATFDVVLPVASAAEIRLR
jgi:two-component system, OmpR family, sensor histidine kinase KdpD